MNSLRFLIVVVAILISTTALADIRVLREGTQCTAVDADGYATIDLLLSEDWFLFSSDAAEEAAITTLDLEVCERDVDAEKCAPVVKESLLGTFGVPAVIIGVVVGVAGGVALTYGIVRAVEGPLDR